MWNILSETDDHPMLFPFVQTYQIHWLSKLCKKYKSRSCCFNLGKFFTSETLTARSIKNVCKFERFPVLEKWKMFQNVLNTLMNIYIQTNNCINQVILNIKHVLSKLQIWEENHYWVLSISTEANNNLKKILIFN